jgi:hypothetical protein
MGYLSDNIPPGKNHAICQDLYPFRIIVQPGYLSDVQLSSIIMDEFPDVEEWQYSGRRRCPVVPTRGKARPIRRKIHPAAYAQNSRYMRPFTEEVIYAFHTEAQRAQVAARFDQERIKYRLEDEPDQSGNNTGPVFIIVP